MKKFLHSKILSFVQTPMQAIILICYIPPTHLPYHTRLITQLLKWTPSEPQNIKTYHPNTDSLFSRFSACKLHCNASFFLFFIHSFFFISFIHFSLFHLLIFLSYKTFFAQESNKTHARNHATKFNIQQWQLLRAICQN